MAALPSISKYCVVCLDLALAFFASKVYRKLVPSIGRCGTPLTETGSGMPQASRMVGTMSMTWQNCSRIASWGLIRLGQQMTVPWRVPPKKAAICFIHLNGVEKAQAQAQAMCG